MSDIYHEGNAEAYDCVWTADGPNGEVVIGFELDVDKSCTVVVTADAVRKLAIELAKYIEYGQSGSDSPAIVEFTR